ncbi:MAG TPA: LPS assembly protein LptD [Gammaproteobacteria bacterium]|nr:LPS assembly protein LptD [Gammaproteobacteria bacterium]
MAAACLIAAARLEAQDVCRVPVPVDNAPADTESPLGERLEIAAGGSSGDAGEGVYELFDGISIRYRGGILSAERASTSEGAAVIEVLENVRLAGDGFEVSAAGASLDRTTEEARFLGAVLDIPARSARATAEEVVVRPQGLISLNEIMFTTCPEDDLDWQLLGRELEIDRPAGFGRARNVRLKFKGVPILWAPYFSFPIDDRRKSGFLAPQISERDRTGFDLTVPVYLNLAPNYDLLLEPRYMEDRGLQVRTSFRYLLPTSDGQLNFERIENDDQLDRARHFIHLEHESRFGSRWQLDSFIDDVSDSAYFEDMGDSLGVISQTHLDRFIDLAYFGPHWSIVSRVQEYQTIDDLIVVSDYPYELRPQMLFQGRWGDRIVGFDSTIEAVDFDRSVGVTGWRLDSTQELSLRFARAGMYLTPAVAMRQTAYRIDDAAPGQNRSPSRALPLTSLDSGLRFERDAGRDRSWIQTIEPRLLYVSIPYQDQSDLPIFDTILPDFNLVQLFNKYRFVGGDRVADTDRVSVGVTTRLIESASGRERISATIGQSRFREPRRIMLPDEPALDSRRSNYVAELGITLSQKWNLDVGYQWSGETEETVRAETRFEFRPENDRLLGVGYRMRKDILEQGDLSLIWPVGERWRVIGQYSYSLLEKEPLERFAGLEYEACCWRLRVTSRRYIVRSTGETDNSISIQLELSGLSQRSATPEELLGRGILSSRFPETN